jgi:hypothetical protein
MVPNDDDDAVRGTLFWWWMTVRLSPVDAVVVAAAASKQMEYARKLLARRFTYSSRPVPNNNNDNDHINADQNIVLRYPSRRIVLLQVRERACGGGRGQ